jgi:hypothetical protein
VVEEAKPDPKAQRDFTDPESRIMPNGANKGSFLQGYNAQIAVDAECQIIVAAEVTQQANDKQQLEPMAKAIVTMAGRLADVTSALSARTPQAGRGRLKGGAGGAQGEQVAAQEAWIGGATLCDPLTAGEREGSGCAPLARDHHDGGRRAICPTGS